MCKWVNCPYCESSKLIKHGKFKSYQRYKCKDCGKTFSEVTNTFFYYGKKSRKLLGTYSKIMFQNKTLREAAEELHIALETSFNWRHKIIEIFNDSNKNNKLKGEVESINCYTTENFKGKKNSIKNQKRRVHAVIPFDSIRRTRPTITSIGTPKMKVVASKLEKILEEEALFYPIGDRFINLYKEKFNKGKLKENTKEKREFRGDDVILSVHWWLARFRGVATKYLEKYLSWFIVLYKRNICLDRRLIEMKEYAKLIIGEQLKS